MSFRAPHLGFINCTAGNTPRAAGAVWLCWFVAFVWVAGLASAVAQTYTWSTFVGPLGGLGSSNGTGINARFYNPRGVAVDAAGNVYVADQSNHLIRKISSSGEVTTVAGLAGVMGSVDGTGAGARFNAPGGVALDGSGNLYVADTGNHLIRKITSAGIVTTLAGTAGVVGSADGTGSLASFSAPNGVTVDGNGNLYVADTGNHLIRKVTSLGGVTSLAGTAGVTGSADGTGVGASFNSPYGVAVDVGGNVFVTDGNNHTIRKVTAAGIVTTIAGTAGVSGNTDGTGSVARFAVPYGVAVDASGNVYVGSYSGQVIRKISSAGVVSTIAGAPAVSGSEDSTPNDSRGRFNGPSGLAVDGSGNVFVADRNNQAIRKLTSGGVVSTFAGLAGGGGGTDGEGNAATFSGPSGITLDGGGNLIVATVSGQSIRKVTPARKVTTLAGLFWKMGSMDGVGSAARFGLPRWGVSDGSGNVYVADTGNHTIRKITSDGVVTTVAGVAGQSGSADGVGIDARFTTPYGVAFDGDGNLYIADTGNHLIRRMTSGGMVTTIAGSAGVSGSLNGIGNAARFSGPRGLAVDAAGNLYVADSGNSQIRKMTNTGMVSTLAGSLGGGSVDGMGTSAKFNSPSGVAVDGFGNVYVADNGNHTIRKINSAGQVTTIGGLAGVIGSGEGVGSNAFFNLPYGLAVDGSGNLFVSEFGNHKIRFGASSLAPPVLYTAPASLAVLQGGSASLSVTAAGSFPISYQWRLGGVPIAGGTGSILTIASAQPSDSGGYDVVISNSAGSITSPAGTLTVNAPPSITAQPSSLGALSGSSATLSVTASGTAPLAYQWRKDGVNIGGGTASAYSIPSALPANAGVYSVVVTNAYGSVSSGTAILTVNTPVTITSQPASVSVTTGSSATLSASATGTEPIMYQWRKNGVLIAGQTGSSLTIANAQPLDAGFYSVQVSNVAGSVTSGDATVMVHTPVTLVSHPASLTVTTGSSATLSVMATGTAPITYQWQKGGVNIPGATSAAYTIGPAQVSDGGAYAVIVTNPAGSVTSQSAILSVNILGAPTYTWSTFAGPLGGMGSSDGLGMAARFYNPAGVVVDGSGTLYVADTANHVIRKITGNGEVTTFAGTPGVSGTTDGMGSAARFSQPVGMALDGAGILYVADNASHLIRKVTSDGLVSTFVGSPNLSGSTDGFGSAALFKNPAGIAVDSSGNVYVADQSNHIIRKITSGGAVSTFAGTALLSGSLDGTGSAARFNSPFGVAVDSSGNVYVGDTANHVIRKITSGGAVSTLAGMAGVTGSTNGTGGGARFANPYGVAIGGNGDLYVGDNSNQRIRKVTSAGVVTTFAGSGVSGSGDGMGINAQFNSPAGVALDSTGNVFVADKGNHVIRRIATDGVVTTLAGTAGGIGAVDGNRWNARFQQPFGGAVTSGGTFYICDTYNSVIRKLTSAGVVTTFAGLVGSAGSVDGVGTSARFNGPDGLAVDAAGNLYVGDSGNHVIRKITTAGVVSTLAGLAGASGSADGLGSAARFNGPRGVAVDGLGNVYVADGSNFTIRKVTSAGNVSTLAGAAGLVGNTNGVGSLARFHTPSGVAADALGNVYVADSVNSVIRKIAPDGTVNTFAGAAGSVGSVDGVGATARFNVPYRVAVDDGGNLYVADTGNQLIRKITSSGAVSTLGGLAGVIGSSDGPGSSARFNTPRSVAVDGAGNLYVVDSSNHKIRFGASSGAPPVLYTPPESLTVAQGGSASLSITAVGSPPISYQWRLNGSPIAGGTASTLTIGSVQASDGGVYDVLLFNSGGMTTSLSGTLTVNSPPSILTQPVSLAVLTGSSATLNVTAAGSAPLVYQWRKGGVNLPGATLPSLSLTGVVVADADGYDVVVTNAFGSVTSGTATLTVNTPVTITSQPVSVSVTPGASPILSVVANGTAPMNYQWFKDGVLVPGATGSDFSLSNVQLLDSGASYRVVVSNPVGSVTSATATLSVSLPVVIMSQPLARTASVGSSAMFSVSATGSVPITYQWRKEGVDIVGATEANYTISSAQLEDAGAYSVVVTNPAGSVPSNAAPLGVNVPGAPTYTWFTLAGPAGGYGANDGPVAVARFYGPVGVTMDGGGNLYIADTSNHVIRKITTDGMVSTLAGLAGANGSVDGPGSAARFDAPTGVALDGAGNLYVTDSGNHTIRRITSSGIVSTFAGTAGSFGSVDGMGAGASFNMPYGLAVSGGGDLYVADSGNGTVRKITNGGLVSTFAGTAGISGNVNGTGSGASFNVPRGVALDGAGNVYVADQMNHLIRKITSDGVVSTFAGAAGVSGSTDGTGTAARFNFPAGLAVDAGGNVYVVEENHTVRRVTSGGVVSTFAGGAATLGSVDGMGSAARFYNPGGIGTDGAGNLFVTDTGNHTVRKITGAGAVSTFAGSPGGSGASNGGRSEARFKNPFGVAVNASGTVYVADTFNHAIRTVSVSGVVSTSAGSLGTVGSIDGTGASGRFRYPAGLALDGSGNVYVADAGNHLIRKMNGAGDVSTFAGTALVSGSVDGTGAAARFNNPNGVTVDVSGNVYVADTGSQLIRKITSVGVVSTLAGMGGVAGSTNGTGSGARFNSPLGVAVDASENVFVGDAWSRVIRKVTGGGVVTTLAGANGVRGATDGTGAVARFYNPGGVAVDSLGNIYVADPGNHVIRRLSSGGIVSTIGGVAGYLGCSEGTGIEARFNNPKSVAVDAAGNLYVADSNNHKIRFGASSAAPPVLYAPPESLTVSQGGSASFSVSAVGSPPMSYQWRLNGAFIVGGTASTLTLGSVQASDEGSYDVLVSSSGGTTTSPAGTLTVNSPPSIVIQPGSLVVTTGSSATLSVAAVGSAPLAYQWRKDGSPIAGGTSSALALSSVQFVSAGTYDVVVTNLLGSVTSNGAALNVFAPVVVSGSPVGGRFNVGASVPLVVTASGGLLSYQWRKDGQAIAGGTGAVLALNSLTQRAAGSYDVVVSNPASSVTSSAALVSVALSCIRGASTNLSFDLPSSFAAGTLTTAQIFAHPAGVSALPVTGVSTLSGGMVSLNLKNVASSGDYFVRFTQLGTDGLSVSVDGVPFGVTLRTWAEGAGTYEALLEKESGSGLDGAAYRGLVVATVTRTGAISGRVQYVEAEPLQDEGGASTGLRGYKPVVRSFSGVLAAVDGDPLRAQYSAALGTGAELGRQEISIAMDFAQNAVPLTASVLDKASDSPQVWASVSAPTVATATRLDAAVTRLGTMDFSDLSGLFNLAADVESGGGRNDGYMLAQVGRSGRVVWMSRFLGRNGSGSGMLNVDDTEAPSVALYQSSVVQPAGLYQSNVLVGGLRFGRILEGGWKMSAGSRVLQGSLERQLTYARRVVEAGETRLVYSDGLNGGEWNGVGAVRFESGEGVRWRSGASNLAPVSIERDSSGQVYKTYAATSVMPGFFTGGGAPRMMRLTLLDPEVDGQGNRLEFGWEVSLLASGQLRAEPVFGSGAPALSLKLNPWYGEITGLYVRNGVRRFLYGVSVPSGLDGLQTGRGWVEQGALPSVQKGEWLLRGNP